MKKNEIVLITSLILFFVVVLFCGSFAYAQMSLDFQGQTYTTGNIPMPSDPTPPPSSSTSSQASQTYYKPKPYKPSFESQMKVQMMGTILDSILQAQQQAQQKAQWEAQQAAIEAQKKAEEAKKAAALKKKLDTQKWIYDFQSDTSVVKINKDKPKVMLLNDDDPYGPKLSSELKTTVKGIYDTSAMSKEDRAKCAAWLQNKANYANQAFGLAGSTEGNNYKHQKDLLMKGEAIDEDCSQAIQTNSIAKIKKPASDYYFPPTMSEEHIRNVYAQTVKDLNKCAAEKNCSPEHVANLKNIQIKAEQELVSHYGIKEN